MRPRAKRRLVISALVSVALLLLCCVGGAAALFLGGLGANPDDPRLNLSACGAGSSINLDKLPKMNELTAEQLRNAAIIVQVGQQLTVPPRGWVVAIGTSLQEATLHNLGDLGDRNDHDSLGLFQQRPSQGWGTPEQILTPSYAAKKFYDKLVTVKGWADMRLTDAAQEVQRSAFPEAYQKWEPLAASIVDTLTGGAARAPGAANPAALACAGPGAGLVSAGGWVAPVTAGIVSGFRTSDRPNHYGVDLGAGRQTPIRAAAGGTVIFAECNAHLGDVPYSCDQDGSPEVSGCGWYVDIRHADNVITRYCHQIRRPYVKVGDLVTAGQVIGLSGTSGNSSGPHLHFEVHLGGDSGNSGAVDPVPWMAAHGAPLGERT